MPTLGGVTFMMAVAVRYYSYTPALLPINAKTLPNLALHIEQCM